MTSVDSQKLGTQLFSIEFNPTQDNDAWRYICTDIMKLLMQHLLDSKDHSSTIKEGSTTHQFNPGKSLPYLIQAIFDFSKQGYNEIAQEKVERLTTLILYQECIHPGRLARQDFITEPSSPLTEDQKTRWQKA